MYNRKKTVISDTGVTEKMDLFGILVCIVSGVISLSLIVLGVLALINV